MEGGVTHEISHVRVLSLLSRVSLLFHVSRLCSLARSLARSLGLFSLCLFSLALSRSHSFSSLSLAQSLALSILSLSHSLALFSHVCMHTHAHARTHARTHKYTTQLAHTTHTSTRTRTRTRTRTPTRTQHTQAHAHAHPRTCCLNEGSFSTSVALTKGVSAPVLTLLTRISLSASYSPADNKTRPCGSGVPGAC
jgi:hypothetical protein